MATQPVNVAFVARGVVRPGVGAINDAISRNFNEIMYVVDLCNRGVARLSRFHTQVHVTVSIMPVTDPLPRKGLSTTRRYTGF